MNKIILSGEVVGEICYSHETRDEKFYIFYMSSERQSGTKDVVPCIVSEVFLSQIENNKQCKIKVAGEVRTRNAHVEQGKTKLEIFVFVKEILEYGSEDENSVCLEGYICKPTSFRGTPLGREICDILVASNREHNNKSDYIPCIAWGRNAIRTSELNVGTRVKVLGRLQSREYNKRLGDETYEARTAYELSSSMVSVVEESEESNENSN